MSEIKANSVSSYKKTAPIEFPTGFSGDGSGLSTPPEIISFTPQPLSVGISTDTDITIVFDQEIQFSGVGTIFIRQGSATGSITTSFTCGISTRATISGVGNTILTIDPAQPLGFGTSYYVILPTIGITNTFGQYYSGIETNRYFFRTQNIPFSATGGNYTFNTPSPSSPTGIYKYHIFTGSGPLVLNVPSLEAVDLTMLMIAGGGGGAGPAPGGGGAGGAGGLVTRTGPTLALSAGTYTITVGAGSPYSGNPSKISSSPTIDILTAFGGGRGTPGPPSPGSSTPGGSGGGGGSGFPSISPTGTPVGLGVPSQGNPGASGSSSSPTIYSGGGGGGAGSAGSGRNGGNGLPNPAFAAPILSPNIPAPVLPTVSITAIGPTGLYGGGGGAWGNPATPYGLPGPGGGGVAPYTAPLRPGRALTGGGGGAGSGNNGGSGVFMIRYAVPSS
jgi:hypothetical protein